VRVSKRVEAVHLTAGARECDAVARGEMRIDLPFGLPRQGEEGGGGCMSLASRRPRRGCIGHRNGVHILQRGWGVSSRGRGEGKRGEEERGGGNGTQGTKRTYHAVHDLESKGGIQNVKVARAMREGGKIIYGIRRAPFEGGHQKYVVPKMRRNWDAQLGSL
jgi:hypothetical protein